MHLVDFMLFVVPAAAVLSSLLLLVAKLDGEIKLSWGRLLTAEALVLGVGFASYSFAAYLSQQM